MAMRLISLLLFTVTFYLAGAIGALAIDPRLWPDWMRFVCVVFALWAWWIDLWLQP